MKLRAITLGLLAALGLAMPAGAQESPPEVSLDIYAIPSPRVVDAVAEASTSLARHGMTSFYAKGQAPHVTLYLTRYDAGAEVPLLAAIEALAKGGRAFPLEVAGTERTASNWIFLHVQPSRALQQLADLVTVTAAPFRRTGGTAPEWMSAYPEKLPFFERYGSPNVFTQFEPHLTLLANETSPALEDWLAEARRTPPAAHGAVEGIGVARVDGHGQIVEILAEYRFEGAR